MLKKTTKVQFLDKEPLGHQNEIQAKILKLMDQPFSFINGKQKSKKKTHNNNEKSTNEIYPADLNKQPLYITYINTNDTNEHRLMKGNDSQGTHLHVYQKARQSP